MVMQDVLDFTGMGEIMDLIKKIFSLTITIELTGAFILFLRFYYEGKGVSWAAYNGLFHSVAAFCNAGFSLFPKNLEGYRGGYDSKPYYNNTDNPRRHRLSCACESSELSI